jgi:hypothetical protein
MDDTTILGKGEKNSYTHAGLKPYTPLQHHLTTEGHQAANQRVEGSHQCVAGVTDM